MRVFLAATGRGMTKKVKEETIERCKPRYILETFFSGEKSCLDAMGVVGNDNFLLDSGAFSYMNGATITKDAMDTYVRKYIEFIKTYNIKYFFEVDVDPIFGLKAVEEWTGLIEREVGYQCIPVWHKERGVEYWRMLCNKYKYIAIGGLVLGAKACEFELYKKLVVYAYNKGVKVHGLGFTKTRILNDYKFYSVDSSSWSVGASRGKQMYTFKGGMIKQKVIDSKGNKIDMSKLASHNMVEWVKYQKYMDGVRY